MTNRPPPSCDSSVAFSSRNSSFCSSTFLVISQCQGTVLVSHKLLVELWSVESKVIHQVGLHGEYLRCLLLLVRDRMNNSFGCRCSGHSFNRDSVSLLLRNIFNSSCSELRLLSWLLLFRPLNHCCWPPVLNSLDGHHHCHSIYKTLPTIFINYQETSTTLWDTDTFEMKNHAFIG